MRGATKDLPEQAEVVVVGGGVIGLSAAHHLAASGVDVLLLERGSLGEGSTCRAAGGVRATFSDAVNVELGLRSLEAYERFTDDHAQAIDLHDVGYLFLLDDERDAERFAVDAALQRSLGLDSRVIDPGEAVRLSPTVSPDGLVAALWSPRAGHCTPESVVAGYATSARRAGARIRTGCTVTGVEVTDGTIHGVTTSAGPVRTSTLVCAAGAWSRAVAGWAGVDLPVTPLRRQVALTDPVPGLDPRTPFTIDFATSFYFHREGAGLLMGMPDPPGHTSDEARADPAWLAALAQTIERRAPGLGDVGVTGGWAGLYEMTPDHNALIGEARGTERLVYATGFSGHGFLMGPAVGEVVADLVLRRTPVVDVAALSVDRFADADGPPAELTIV